MRRLLLSLVIAAAYFFTLSSLLSCHIWESSSETGGMSAGGLFSFSYRFQECIDIRRLRGTDWGFLVELGPSAKFAQAMGVLAGIFGGMAVLLTLFGSCLLSFFTISKKTWRTALAGSIWGALVCQALTFTLWVDVNKREHCGQDDVQCKLGFGGLCIICACILYLLAGTFVSILALQPPKDNVGTTFLARLGVRFMKKVGLTWKQHPFGALRWQDLAIFILALLLLNFSLTVLLDCRFYVVSFQNNTREYEEGLRGYYYYPEKQCKFFETGSLQSFTAQTRAANAFGIMTVIVGGIMALALFAMIFVFNFPSWAINSLPGLSFFAAICQSLVFLGNSERNEILCAEDIEDQSCHLGPDAYLAMINVFLYVFFIPGLWWYKNNPNYSFPEQQEEDNLKEQPYSPDQDVSPPQVDTEVGNQGEEGEERAVHATSIGSGTGNKED